MKKSILIVVILLTMGAIGGFFVTGCEVTKGTKECVVMIGDSIFALSDKEAKYLEALTGDTYRKYYISAAQMIGGVVKPIPDQFRTALEDGPIRTVIMDGGGNDVLIGGRTACSADYETGVLSAECYEIMDNVLAEAENLIQEAVASGVENCIYQSYYYVMQEDLWLVTDVFLERAEKFIAAMNVKYAPAKIVYVDPRMAFMPEDMQGGELPHPQYTRDDLRTIEGIHPTDAGSKILAELIYKAMVDNNIEINDPCPASD